MKKLVWGLLFSTSFLLSSWAFAQSSGVLVSPPVQNQGSNQDNSGNSGNNGGNSTSNSSNKASSAQSSQNTTTPPNTASKRKHRAPSEASINACQDKSEGDACEVTGSHWTRAGICAYTSDKKYLFCRRSHKKTHAHGSQQQGQNN